MRNNQNEIQHLKNWCVGNQLKIRPNPEVFFVNGRTLIKPEFVVNNKIYIDLVNDTEVNDNYIEYGKSFSKSFGTMVIIKRSDLINIHNVTKDDLENYFNIKF